MPRQDNKQMLQPIDVIFRFLQSISFLVCGCINIPMILLFFLTNVQNACSNLAVRSDEYAS